jgi:hypothetical protein
MSFYLRKRAARLNHTHNKEQHQQRYPNGFYRFVDVDNDAPYRAAFEVLRRLGDKLPDFSQFLIPCIECVL